MKAKLTVNSKGKQRVKVSMTVKESELIEDLLGSTGGGYNGKPLKVNEYSIKGNTEDIRKASDNLYYALVNKEESQNDQS